MDKNGKNVKRLTNEPGYDGGAFFSPDSKMIVYRGSHPKTEAEIKRYKDLLAQHLIVPTIFEVWVMNADGTNKRQVTKLKRRELRAVFHARRQTHHLLHKLFCDRRAQTKFRSGDDKR